MSPQWACYFTAWKSHLLIVLLTLTKDQQAVPSIKPGSKSELGESPLRTSRVDGTICDVALENGADIRDRAKILQQLKEHAVLFEQ